jgi:hypothetical protein
VASSAIRIESKDLRSRFLEGLTESEREAILKAAKPRSIPAHSVVINQGQLANSLFLLTAGRARHFFMTEDGHKILLHWLVPGDCFGGFALLAKPGSYLVSTETLKDSGVLVWDRITIRGLVARYPRLLDNGLLVAADYLAWYLAANEALTCHPGSPETGASPDQPRNWNWRKGFGWHRARRYKRGVGQYGRRHFVYGKPSDEPVAT